MVTIEGTTGSALAPLGLVPKAYSPALFNGWTLNFVKVAVLLPTPPALSQYNPPMTVGWRNTVWGLPSCTHAPGTPLLFGACSAVTVLPRRISRNQRCFWVTPFRLAV